MSSLRNDLQSDDPLQQAAALLQLLNSMAGGRDVGTAVTITSQTVVKGAAPPAVKRLAYDVVKAAALTDADWENVITGFLTDSSPAYPSTEVQIAALEILPLIPPHKLRSLLSPDGRLSGTLTRQLATSSKEVRAAAFSAAGRWLSDASSTSVLAAIPDAATLPRKWVQSITDGLVDSGQAAAAAAFDAARQLLSSTEEDKLEAGGHLRQILAMQITSSMLKTLPSLLQRGLSLEFQGQVSAAAAMVALVEFCSRQPVFPNPLPAPSADTPGGGDLMTILEERPTPNCANRGTVVVEQIGNHLQSLLGHVYAPLVYEAAQGLLKICALAREREHGTGQKPAAAATWATVAVAALVQLWEKSGSGGTSLHSPLVSAAAASIKSLPAQGQLQLASQIMPMIATIPSAAERTACLAHVWGAIVELDLATRRAERAGDKAGPANELRRTLTEPFLLGVISASEIDDGSASYAALREEMVCTLVETLLSHPQGVIKSLERQDGGSEQSASLMATIKEAARAQSAGLRVDWLGTAKIALQGTKACLGWDRDTAGGTYACTAVTDSWLVLLQRGLQAAGTLQTAPQPPNELRTVLDAARVAASHVGAFQELLDQLLMHWQALSGAVQPRALWVAAHHYELAPSMDSGWAHLLQALAMSFGAHDDDARTRRKQALKAAAAAGQMQPVMPEDSGVASPIDEAEIRTEAMSVGLVAADRLASLLLYNAEVGPRPGLKDISVALVAILQQLAAPNSTAGPQSRERAARVAAYLGPLARAPAPSAEAGEAIAVQTEFGAKLLHNPDWPLNEGFPMAGPSGATLQATRRGSRYWALKSQVQAAIRAASGRNQQAVEPIRDLPEAVGISDVMSLISEAGEMGKGSVLTAINDPLRLTAWHVLDRQTSRVTLQFEAYNNLSFGMEKVAIRLGLGGPMVPEAKQPPAYMLAVLPSRDQVTWRFDLRIVGFGRISVQPFISLPVNIQQDPGDTLAMRCEQYKIPATALLLPPLPVPSPDVFFPAWPSLALGTELTAVCRNKGAVGGLQALTALESGPFARVYFQGLPAQGGFHAAYAADAMGGAKLAIVITAQLLPIGRSPRSLSGETVPTGHVVCRMSFRSTQEDVIETINDDPGNWVRDLFGRTMVEGMNADGLSGPPLPFRIDPSLIPVERLYVSPPDSKDVDPEELRVQKDPHQVAEEAVRNEWHRLWQQRMGLAS